MKCSLPLALAAFVVCFNCIIFQPRASAAESGCVCPDTIYYDGKLVTVNKDFAIAQAVAIRDGRIVAVGSTDEVQRLATSNTRKVDLGGKTMLPGFYDNHIHIQFGIRGSGVKLMATVRSPLELQPTLDKLASNVPKGEWITVGVQRPYWHMELPNRQQLDAIAPHHPVALISTHKTAANSLALEQAGISKDTPKPKGGWIVREAGGEPTGILLEGPAKDLLNRVMPHEEHALGDATIQRNVYDDLARYPAMGITSVNAAGVFPRRFRFVQDVYDRYGSTLPRMTMQVWAFPGYENVEETIKMIEGLGFHTGFGDDRLKYGAIKMVVDGGIAAPDFWTIDPYDGEVEFEEKGPYSQLDFRGNLLVPYESLYAVGKRADELGWQLGIHAIGDAAIVETVDVLARIMAENSRPSPRHYIHHFTLMPPGTTLEKMAQNNILVGSSPNFTYFNTRFMQAAVSGDRLQTQNPQRTLLDHGIRLSYGSDGLPAGPLLGIWAAVTRLGYDGQVYGANESVSVEEAIRAYTIGPSYLTFEEDDRGSIEVGKMADLVVLGDDILTINPSAIRDIPVELTIIGGEEVFSGNHVTPYYQELPLPAP